jgi:hypothetical protein
MDWLIYINKYCCGARQYDGCYQGETVQSEQWDSVILDKNKDTCNGQVIGD